MNLSWKWYLKDLANVEKNGFNVFSCFSCGGGSSMGYKLAGFNVIGNCEIDHAMNKLYVANHHPKYNYNMDVRELGAIDNDKLPEELLHLDILDGSPPCTSYSMAGRREEQWGKEKKFREGQKLQRLDDLFFEFIKIVKKLRPKTVIAENVRGLASGNAKGYVNEIIKAYKDAGYKTQMFLLNAATMGVPQIRERVIFVSSRSDLNYPKIKLSFSEKPVLFGDVRTEHGKPFAKSVLELSDEELLKYRKKTDTSMCDINLRVRGKYSGFTRRIDSDDRVAFTLTANGSYYRMCDALKLTDQDMVNISTFPQDYDFVDQSVQYVCGMSVPPLMMARVAHEVDRQWLRPGEGNA